MMTRKGVAAALVTACRRSTRVRVTAHTFKAEPKTLPVKIRALIEGWNARW